MTSPEAFFALVDRHVTVPMEAAGYAKIAEYDVVTDGLRAVPLVAARPQWLATKPWFRNSRLPLLLSRRPKLPKERVLSVGYEGFDEDGEDDEKWLDYFPGTEELDLAEWSEELEGHAEWDLWNDRDVPTIEELERRLRIVGEAMRGRTKD